MEDQTIDLLCLFCSSTVLPHQKTSRSCKFPSWTTPCCLQPICESCLSRNPRLLYYNPCLKCLTGVEALEFRRRTFSTDFPIVEQESSPQFVIANDEYVSDVEDKASDLRSDTILYGTSSDIPRERLSNGTTKMESDRPSARYQSSAPTIPVIDSEHSINPRKKEYETSEAVLISNSEYCIKPKDTLMGIALKLGIDARKLCTLNKLTMSTTTTCPQFLHTLTVLKLPPGTRVPSPPPSLDSLRKKELERVGKRIQLVTKETDYIVAKSYTALAEDDPAVDKEEKVVSGSSKVSISIEDRAINTYYEDDAWEKEMKRHGASGHIAGFPYFSEYARTGVKTKYYHETGASFERH